VSLRIAIVAHGRFHAFDLARALRGLGHDVALFSNYPAWAVERFGVRRDDYTGLGMHGGVERLLARCGASAMRNTEASRHRWFGRWAARALEGRSWDVVHCWSGASEEALASTRLRARCRVLMRGSAHILEQAGLLADEERRVGVALDRPSDWMIARELREYERADRILVLSEFARASFERHGIGADRVSVLPLGVEATHFRPSPTETEGRIARVASGAPLTVLYVGALSAQKGLHDLVDTARRCEHLPIRFVLAGARLPEAGALLSARRANIVELGARDQRDLAAVYAQADLFMFPTLQDGFGMVLTQAAAAGLVILATPHCAAPEILAHGAEGWVLPIRSAGVFAERLRWCHEHRDQVAAMLRSAAAYGRVRSWTEVAAAFARDAEEWMASASTRKAVTR
jgi:glycosyltransferase involved in cell wall biosynthesis